MYGGGATFFYTLSLDGMLLKNISQVSQYVHSNYMCKYNFITRYFLVQFIKINVLSRESPPISQTKQTIPLHHAPCVPFFGLWIQRSSSFSAVFEEKTNTVSLTVWNPYYGYFVSMYLRHNLLVGQAQYYTFRHQKHMGFRLTIDKGL